MVSIVSLKQKMFVTPQNVFSDSGIRNLRVALNIYLNDLPQTINKTGSYLYADDTSAFYQNKNKVLNKEFLSICEWFIDNTLSIHFVNDKTKTIFFSRLKSPPKLSISYGDYSLKQHNIVENLGCYFNSNLNR